MNKFKKFIALVLSIATIGTNLVYGGIETQNRSNTLGISVSAADLSDGLKLAYILNQDGDAVITQGTPTTSGILYIPSTIDGYKIVGITNGVFKGNTDIKLLLISEGIEYIGNNAFRDCTNLYATYFPSSLTQIGDYAFSGCTAQFTLSLPDKLENIGQYAFENNTSVRSIHFSNNADTIVDLSRKGVFSNCESVEDIVLPKHLIASVGIGEDVFSGCSSLKTVRFAGNTNEFSDITIQDGNDEFRNAVVQCNFNKKAINKVLTDFDPSVNAFKFSNNELSDFSSYNMSAEDYKIATQKFNDIEIGDVDRYLDDESSRGYCYGLSVLSLLIYKGIVDPSVLCKGATNASEVKLSNKVVSPITYYQLLQLTDTETLHDVLDIVNEPYHIDNIVKEVSAGEPVVISFKGNFEGSFSGHAVLGYGVENGSFVYNGKEYTNRVLVYDSNSPELGEDFDIYFDDDNNYSIPFYENELGLNNFYITSVSNDISILNYKGLYENTTEFDWNTKIETGDIDLDGSITVNDIIYLQNYLLKRNKFTKENYDIADINFDGKVNVYDLALLKRKLLHKNK